MKNLRERPEVTTLCTADEARVIISRQPSGVRFFFGGRVELPTSETSAFPGYGVVKISRAQALHLVDSLLENLEKRGARVEIRERGGALFI